MPANDFTYVYILVSENDPRCHNSGATGDLKDRLATRNDDSVAHTANFGPWRIETAIAYTFWSREPYGPKAGRRP